MSPPVPTQVGAQRRRPTRATVGAALLLIAAAAGPVHTQPVQRQVRVEVRDRDGRMLPDVHVEFLPTGDSTTTDSSGLAFTSIEADSSMTISVRKIASSRARHDFPLARRRRSWCG